MRAEDLFQAIGSVEESRLARTELSVPSRENQEDKTMKHTDPQPQRLMTYSQWCTIFKYRLKKYIRRKLYNGLQWLLFILFMVGIPYGMIVHWLFFGY